MNTEYEQILISCYKDEMISYMNTHPEAFNEALQLALSDKQPFAWRSASLIWSCMGKDDERIRPFIKDILKVIKDKKDGHQRELLKILLEMEVEEDQESQLFDICISAWENINKNPSVRITAFKMLLKITAKYPELTNEIHGLTQSHYLESLSPGVRNSVSRMIKETNRLKD